MTIWMVTGLHDPKWLCNVLENFARQPLIDKRLIFVENGAGVGAIRGVPYYATLLQSEAGAAQPLNAALSWLRQHGQPSDWFVKCDADDYYGPRYLDSLQPAIDAHVDYAGRSSLYIRTTDHRLWFAEGKTDSYVFHGPTIAARIGAALDFPVVKDWGEDAEWCMAMHAAGRTCITLPPEHVCYQRWADNEHAWPCTDEEIRSSWSAEFRDLGPVDLNVVNGLRPRPLGASLGICEATFANSMPIRLLKQRLGKVS